MMFPGFPRGVCFDTGLSGAASAAGQVASTALQVSELDKARKEANQAGQTAATNISAAGANAAGYYSPYVSEGTNMLSNIEGNMGTWGNIDNNYTNSANGVTDQAKNSYSNLLTNGITQQSIENTPGWSAINNLGQQAVTNSAAARGLANSGAAQKGAANYASTMADQTYQNLYNDQLNTTSGLSGTANNYLATNSANQGNITNTWNRENALLGYGSQAAGAAASNAYNTGVASNQALMEGATGSVAATTGIGNALQSGASGLGNTASQYSMYSNLLNGGSGSSYGNGLLSEGDF